MIGVLAVQRPVYGQSVPEQYVGFFEDGRPNIQFQALDLVDHRRDIDFVMVGNIILERMVV
jgi:hypothetical protein